MDLYAPQTAIIERLNEKLQPFELREVYSDTTLDNIYADTIQAPSVAVVPAPFVILEIDNSLGSTLIETRWQVVPVERAHNDRGRGTRAQGRINTLVVETIRHLSAWSPAEGFGVLMLRAVPPRRSVKGKLFTPLVFGSSATIEASTPPSIF